MTAISLCLNVAFGQPQIISEFEKKAFKDRQAVTRSLASQWFDVTYCKLDLNITSQPDYLKGCVTVSGICRQNDQQSLTLDLASAMEVDSIFVNGTKNTFVQGTDAFEILLDRPYQNGEMLAADIYYQRFFIKCRYRF